MAEDSSKKDERRTHDRTPVTLIVEYGSAGDMLEDYTVNLSLGGTFVHTEREFTIGTDVDLVLSFPGLLQPLHLAGVVRWTSSSEDEMGVGIEFNQHDHVAKARLESVIAAIEAGDPDYVGNLVRILLAEDNLHVARLIREGLAQGARRQSFRSGVVFDFTDAPNGQEAADCLDNGTFDLFVIDMFLPILDGVTLIERIKAHDKHQCVPVVAMSSGGASAKEQAEAAGCDHFLDKPFRLRELIALVQGILSDPPAALRSPSGSS